MFIFKGLSWYFLFSSYFYVSCFDNRIALIQSIKTLLVRFLLLLNHCGTSFVIAILSLSQDALTIARNTVLFYNSSLMEFLFKALCVEKSASRQNTDQAHILTDCISFFMYMNWDVVFHRSGTSSPGCCAVNGLGKATEGGRAHM